MHPQNRVSLPYPCIAQDDMPFPVRKAYKRKALQTHPDRLPPGATPEDKAASEELFRKVKVTHRVQTVLTLI